MTGWDPPLRSVFAQVIDTEADEDDDRRIVLWIDGVPGPVARIPEALHATLWCDHLASVPR